MRLVSTVVVATALGLGAAPVSAEQSPAHVAVGQQDGSGGLEISADLSGATPGATQATVVHGTGPALQPEAVVDCTTLDAAAPSTQAAINQCSVATPLGGAAAPGPTPQQQAAQFAIDYFRSLDLPKPEPVISAPNGGICGAVHSLDLRIPQQVLFTDPETAFGPLVVHVSGVFDVDWGDGHEETFRSSGGPWPNSAVSHSWANSGHYDIRVTARWSATWSFGQYSGVLSGLSTSGAITGWPVFEAQAVIIN